MGKRNNQIETKKKGISFYVKIKNISKNLKGDSKITVIIDGFAKSSLKAKILNLSFLAYNKRIHKIEKYNEVNDDFFDTTILINQFDYQINNYPNLDKKDDKIIPGKGDVEFNIKLRNEGFFQSFFPSELKLIFIKRIFNKQYWIPIWLNLGQFKVVPQILKDMKKYKEYLDILNDSDLKDLTNIFLDLDINKENKIQNIIELSKYFDQEDQNLIKNVTKELHEDEELLKIQFLNIVITLRNIMKKN